MIEEPLVPDNNSQLSIWERHRFWILVSSCVIVSLFLAGVSLALYASSGAAQLDLTRPGYQSVRQQAGGEDKLDAFPSTGELDGKSLEQFRKLYDERAKQATSVDSFGGGVMSDESLSIDALPVQN
jgi:hypothetical protein